MLKDEIDYIKTQLKKFSNEKNQYNKVKYDRRKNNWKWNHQKSYSIKIISDDINSN